MTLEEKACEYVINNVCNNCNNCQSKGYIGCDTFRFAKNAYIGRAKEEMLDPFGNTYVSDLRIENKELREQLEQAKEIIKEYVDYPTNNDELWELYKKAENFIKE